MVCIVVHTKPSGGGGTAGGCGLDGCGGSGGRRGGNGGKHGDGGLGCGGVSGRGGGEKGGIEGDPSTGSGWTSKMSVTPIIAMANSPMSQYTSGVESDGFGGD